MMENDDIFKNNVGLGDDLVDFNDSSGSDEQELEEGKEDFDIVDESLNDIDFSEFKGDFKSSLKKIDGKLKAKRPRIVKKRRKPEKVWPRTYGVKHRATLVSDGNKTQRILVPKDKKVIVEHVDKFILSHDETDNIAKNIGYYKGEKLSELVFIFNNDTENDFTMELFNPSMPLDYLFNTSQNLNNKIQVAGGNAASYSDVLFYLLANPTLIPNAKVLMSGNSLTEQRAIGMSFRSKNIKGEMVVDPLNMNSEVDAYQFQSGVILFDIMGRLDRAFIPDGMDVVSYRVLAGMTVTICFYYKQKQLKKLLWDEAKTKTKLL